MAIKLPLSQTTRQRALDAFKEMPTDALLQMLEVAPQGSVNAFYKRNIEQSIARDVAAAKEWMPDVSTDGLRPKGRAAGEADVLGNMLDVLGPDVDQASRPGSQGGGTTQHNTLETRKAPRASQFEGPQTRVRLPETKPQRKAREALEEVYSGESDVSSNDGGGSGGFGF